MTIKAELEYVSLKNHTQAFPFPELNRMSDQTRD
jgi:hypothetical protein